MKAFRARWLLAVLTLAVATPLQAQAPGERERQQMMQLQQLLQKLRQENAELQQSKARELDAARSEAQGKIEAETAKQRAGSASAQREARRLGGELAQAREALSQHQAEIEKLKGELAQRDAALRSAAAQQATERSSGEADRGLLAARLKLNAQRAESCEAKHASAMQLSQELLELHEKRELRACEPFTGLWRVRAEERAQALRDRLFEARLDVPPGEAAPTAQ